MSAPPPRRARLPVHILWTFLRERRTSAPPQRRAHLRFPARLTRPAHIALGPELETMFIHLLIGVTHG